MHIAVIAARGLGDGLLSMILTHNLCSAGYTVTCFSSILCSLQDWFPGKTISPLPSTDNFNTIFSQFDRLLVTDHAWIDGQYHFGNEMILLKECELDRRQTMVENLKKVCQNRLGLKEVSVSNGICPPEGLKWQRHPRRVILHPTSSCLQKNWPSHRYLKLCQELKANSFEPTLCVSPSERPDWEKYVGTLSINLPHFPSLHELASYIYESGGMIGNDSGVGHLASCLNIPTLSLFARKSHAALWRPGWREGCGQVLTAPAFLLGASLKERLWKNTISPKRVAKTFCKMMKNHH